MLIAATAALIALIPSLRRFSHGTRTPERDVGVLPVRDEAVESAFRRGDTGEPRRLPRWGERQFVRRPVGQWRSSEQVQLYDASEVERLVREQLYGSRSRRS